MVQLVQVLWKWLVDWLGFGPPRGLEVASRRVQVGPLPIFYEVTGQGPPLVLVHGISGSTRWWRHNLPALAAYFRVYSIDLIGFGQSRGRHKFVLSDAASLIVRWMDEVGLERATFIGHSMGGFIVSELAADHPARVERLVLVNAAGLPFNLNRMRHALGLLRAVRYLPFNFIPILLTDSLRMGPVTLWRATSEILSSDLTRKLEQIRVPVLVVWGEFDTIVPLQLGQRFGEHIRDLRFCIIPDTGHNPMWEDAPRFNRIVLDFLLNPRPGAIRAAAGQAERARDPL